MWSDKANICHQAGIAKLSKCDVWWHHSVEGSKLGGSDCWWLTRWTETLAALVMGRHGVHNGWSLPSHCLKRCFTLPHRWQTLGDAPNTSLPFFKGWQPYDKKPYITRFLPQKFHNFGFSQPDKPKMQTHRSAQTLLHLPLLDVLFQAVMFVSLAALDFLSFFPPFLPSCRAIKKLFFSGELSKYGDKSELNCWSFCRYFSTAC